MKKAIVIGASGMVGTQLIQLLLKNNSYSEILSLVRRPTGVKDPKLTELVIDFDHLDVWSEQLKGDVLFSTFGTTISQAKSKDAQYHVDFTYQYNVAEIAAKNGVKKYVLVSSAGASSKSNSFYLCMKGKLEDAVQTLGFEVINIIRPGQLAGQRVKKRLGEQIALTIMTFLNQLGILKNYKPIQAEEVAAAMIVAANKTDSGIYTLSELFELANQLH